MHDPELNTPGFWFVAPYRGINGEQKDKPWVGPAIYDGRNGELVWSGGLMVNSNVEDFRLSEINGERVLTLMANSKAYVLNDDYSVRRARSLETEGVMNTHELNFVQDGMRAIFLKNAVRWMSKQDSLTLLGVEDDCVARHDGFSVLDVTQDDWPSVWDWQSQGKIGLDESTYFPGEPANLCRSWDFM